MNLTSPTNLSANQPEFTDVIVHLLSFNQVLMQKCTKCGFVIRKHERTRSIHSQWCPSKWSFKYQHDNKKYQSVTAMCSLCQTTIFKSKISEMKSHHLGCKSGQLQIDSHDIPIGNEIEYVHETTVCPQEMRCVRQFAHFTSGFKTVFAITLKGLERFFECQRCSKLIKSAKSRDRHRETECVTQIEVLISTTTQHNSCVGSTISRRICFICNTTSSESYVNFCETTEHSKTPLHSWKFLNDKPPARRGADSDSRLLCAKCFEKINKCDLACVNSARLEAELRHDLSLTEAKYSRTLTRTRDASNSNGTNDIEIKDENESKDDVLFTVELSDDDDVEVVFEEIQYV